MYTGPHHVLWRILKFWTYWYSVFALNLTRDMGRSM